MPGNRNSHDRRARGSRLRPAPVTVGLITVVTLQLVCALFFVWEIGASIFGIRREPLSWQAREFMELGAALGLVLGVGFGAVLLARVIRRNRLVEGRLRNASAAFTELLEERFAEWGLTPSERDVAWFTVKGLTIAEIARVRSTSEGTVKAQSNAIYRKAGISGRAQLLSLFIEDLLEEGPADRAAPDRAAPDRATPDRAAPDRATPDRAAPDRATPDRPGQTGPDRTSADRAEADAAPPARHAPGRPRAEPARPDPTALARDEAARRR